MEPGSVRKYDSEIVVEQNDDWSYKGNQIIQEKVLDFFRKNLHEDEDGIYIQNKYGNFVEYGYITTIGFPLQITNFVKDENTLCLRGTDCLCVPLEDWKFYYRKDERIFGIKKNHKFLKYAFSRDFLNFISLHLKEGTGEYFLEVNSSRIPISQFREKFEVDAPKFP